MKTWWLKNNNIHLTTQIPFSFRSILFESLNISFIPSSYFKCSHTFIRKNARLYHCMVLHVKISNLLCLNVEIAICKSYYSKPHAMILYSMMTAMTKMIIFEAVMGWVAVGFFWKGRWKWDDCWFYHIYIWLQNTIHILMWLFPIGLANDASFQCVIIVVCYFTQFHIVIF